MTDASQVLAAVDRTVTQIQEAMRLLSDLPQPNLDETLADLHQRLLVTRSAQSRTSELVSQLVRLRGRIKNALLDAQGELETATANVVEKPTFGHANFASGEERRAKLAFQTMEERRAVRQTEKLLTDVEAALEYGNNRFWELNRGVRDIEVRLQLILKEPNIG